MHVGESALVTIDATSGKDLNGKVVEIVPSADPASRTFVVKVALPSAMALRTGMFGRARFARGERSAILVPRTALVNRGQLQGIYIVDSNDIVALRYITLGSAVNDQFEILSGLEAGEKLVAAPDGREYAGKKIVERP